MVRVWDIITSIIIILLGGLIFTFKFNILSGDEINILNKTMVEETMKVVYYEINDNSSHSEVLVSYGSNDKKVKTQLLNEHIHVLETIYGDLTNKTIPTKISASEYISYYGSTSGLNLPSDFSDSEYIKGFNNISNFEIFYVCRIVLGIVLGCYVLFYLIAIRPDLE